MAYRVITTVALVFVIFILSLALFSSDGGKRSTRFFLFFAVIVQLMSIGHVWR